MQFVFRNKVFKRNRFLNLYKIEFRIFTPTNLLKHYKQDVKKFGKKL